MTQFNRFAMPSIKRSNSGRGTRNVTKQMIFRAHRAAEQREERNEIERNRISKTRSIHAGTQQERENANVDDMNVELRRYRLVGTNRI